jgi:hypothetical protein
MWLDGTSPKDTTPPCDMSCTAVIAAVIAAVNSAQPGPAQPSPAQPSNASSVPWSLCLQWLPGLRRRQAQGWNRLASPLAARSIAGPLLRYHSQWPSLWRSLHRWHQFEPAMGPLGGSGQRTGHAVALWSHRAGSRCATGLRSPRRQSILDRQQPG